MIITCLIMVILSLKQSADIRGLYDRIEKAKQDIQHYNRIDNNEWIKELEKQSMQEIIPAFFQHKKPIKPMGRVGFGMLRLC